MQILLISPVLKRMREVIIHTQPTLRQHPILLLILRDQPEPQEDDDKGKTHVAAQVHAEGDEVPRGVSVEEDLGAYFMSVSVSVSLALYVERGWVGGRGRVPMELPTAQETKVAATTVDFLVAPAMLRETIERQRVWADQKERVM
jgi:hypothetical protein